MRSHLMGRTSGFSNYQDDTVTELRASDGARLGNFTVGRFPVAVAFDGANVWVANFSSNNVTELRARDGANLGTFNTGNEPDGIAFDGVNVWVSNYHDGTVTKLLASNGSLLGTSWSATSRQVSRLTGSIWVANNADDTLSKL